MDAVLTAVPGAGGIDDEQRLLRLHRNPTLLLLLPSLRYCKHI